MAQGKCSELLIHHSTLQEALVCGYSLSFKCKQCPDPCYKLITNITTKMVPRYGGTDQVLIWLFSLIKMKQRSQNYYHRAWRIFNRW